MYIPDAFPSRKGNGAYYEYHFGLREISITWIMFQKQMNAAGQSNHKIAIPKRKWGGLSYSPDL